MIGASRTGRPKERPCAGETPRGPTAGRRCLYHDRAKVTIRFRFRSAAGRRDRPVGLGNPGADGYDPDGAEAIPTPRRDRRGWPPSVREDGMNLLALVESPDHVCCRYRIRAFAPALEQAGWSLTCEGSSAASCRRTFQLRRAARFDAVILQRKLLPAWQLRILRRAARRLVFDFDDAVLFRDSNDPRGPDDRRRRRRFAAMMRRWPTRSSPATTSWPTAPCEPGPGSRTST